MQQDDPWSIGLVDKPAQAKRSADPLPPSASLKEALLELDYNAAPVFAVLDGAQFDNLPQALMMGNFVSRPLYRDRGDNNPEQIITAPHMVWLDESREKVAGRGPKKTIPALFNLIGDRPAAVFWQCPDGADALYKHLRGVNMVLYPKAAIADFDGPVCEGPQNATTSETHILALFRHADANVLAQVLPAMDSIEVTRLFGPALRLLFAPKAEWEQGRSFWFMDRPEYMPNPRRGQLMISKETVDRIDRIRLQHTRNRVIAYLRRVAPDQTRDMADPTLDALTRRYMDEAHSYGVCSEAAIGRWSFLQLMTSGRMSDQKEISDYISQSDGKTTADERVRNVMRALIFNSGAGSNA